MLVLVLVPVLVLILKAPPVPFPFFSLLTHPPPLAPYHSRQANKSLSCTTTTTKLLIGR